MTDEEVELLAENVKGLRAQFQQIDAKIDEARVHFAEFGVKTNELFYAEMKARRNELGEQLADAERELRTAARANRRRRRQEVLAEDGRVRAQNEARKAERLRQYHEMQLEVQRQKTEAARIRQEAARERMARSREKKANRHISRYFMDVAYEELPNEQVQSLRQLAEQRQAEDLDSLSGETPDKGSS